MKKITILATVALVILALSASVFACESSFHDDNLVEKYADAIEAGNYYHEDDKFFASVIEGTEVFQTYDALLICNDDCICGNTDEIVGVTSVSTLVAVYTQCIENGNYYSSDASMFTVSINNAEVYMDIHGNFFHNGNLLIDADFQYLLENPIHVALAKYYAEQIQTGNYIKQFGDMSYVVITEDFEVLYITCGGMFACNNIVIYDNLATMDKPVQGAFIYKMEFSAITHDSDFIYVYYFGEIVDIINIHTGGHPKG